MGEWIREGEENKMKAGRGGGGGGGGRGGGQGGGDYGEMKRTRKGCGSPRDKRAETSTANYG